MINFQNEYIKKLNIKLKLGISVSSWKIYNNFIFMLYIAVEENNNIIKKYEKIIKKNLDEWLENNIKLKTRKYTVDWVNSNIPALTDPFNLLKSNNNY